MAKATMEDVARLAGVNKATVSRALRGDSRISQTTREKVWKTAKELGYRLDL
ncbi:MAG: LacI family DNA-binding transcriptional regulator, partial [Aminivibrio sp.]|nr:LacI family DNA-binding transcriptional regulator [Aminivibrio sp.]